MKPAWLLVIVLCLPACASSDPAPGAGEPPPVADPAPTGRVAPGLEAFRPLLGLTPEQAERWLQEHPTEHERCQVTVVRVCRSDGEHFALTMDLRADRLNVELDGGKITVIESVG